MASALAIGFQHVVGRQLGIPNDLSDSAIRQDVHGHERLVEFRGRCGWREALEVVRLGERLLHRLEGGQVRADVRALDGARALEPEPGLAAVRVVLGGLEAGAEVDEADLEGLLAGGRAEEQGAVVGVEGPLEHVRPVAAEAGDVAIPQRVLDRPLVRDVEVVGLHDHEHAGRTGQRRLVQRERGRERLDDAGEVAVRGHMLGSSALRLHGGEKDRRSALGIVVLESSPLQSHLAMDTGGERPVPVMRRITITLSS
nr:hypothetical protein CFP56_07530 [Quercus suber]